MIEKTVDWDVKPQDKQTNVMTLTYFIARSARLPIRLNGGKLLKCHLKRTTCRKLAFGQNIDYSENNVTPGLHLLKPLGLNTIIIPPAFLPTGI